MIFREIIPSQKSLDSPYDQSKEKNQDGDLIDPMHHSQVEVGRLVRVRLLKHPHEIIPNFTQLEEFLNFIFF